MNYAVLSEVAQIIMGQSPPSSTYNSIGEGLPFFQGKADFGDLYPRPRVFCSQPNRIAEAGDILISVRAPVGPTNLTLNQSCIGRGLSAIRVGAALHRDYLFYFLRFYEPELAKAGTGSTFSAISRDDLETIKLPLPSLPEQQRIAAILQKADRIRRLRRQARQLSDSFLQSVFLEMFGDPVINPKKFHEITLNQACEEIYRYPTFYGFQYSPTGIPVVRINNILANGLVNSNLSTYVFINSEINDKFPRTKLELNDIVMAVRGDGSTGKRIGMITSTNLVGANISPNLLRFKPRKKVVSPFFLFQFMTCESGQKLIEQNITRTAKKTITAEDIKAIKIPIPSLVEQQIFDRVWKEMTYIKNAESESERQAEQLFQSLLRRAFAGEL